MIGRLFKYCFLTLVLLIVFRNFATRWAVSYLMGQALGASVTIEKAHLGILDTDLLLKGIRIASPEGFEGEEVMLVRQLFFDLEIASLLRGQLRFEEVYVDIPKVNVIRNRDGQVNLLSLKAMRSEPASTQTSAYREEKRSSKIGGFHIDTLVLSLGEAHYVDLSSGESVPRTFRLGLDRATYHHLESTRQIVQIIAGETLKRIGLKVLSGFAGRSQGLLGRLLGA